jgi:hypothetical protein
MTRLVPPLTFPNAIALGFCRRVSFKKPHLSRRNFWLARDIHCPRRAGVPW